MAVTPTRGMLITRPGVDAAEGELHFDKRIVMCYTVVVIRTANTTKQEIKMEAKIKTSMKALVNYQQVKGHLGQDVNNNGMRWLFVESRKTGRSYPVALVDALNGEIVHYEPQQQMSDFTNEQVADALLEAARS